MAITVNSGVSLNTLFSSLSTNKSTANIYSSLSDLNSIRSGSYGKLLKKYYSETGNDTSSVKKATNNVTSNTSLALSNTRSDTKALKSAANTLKDESTFAKTNGEYDTAKITSAVKDFVKSYNNTIEDAASVNSSSVKSSISAMQTTTKTYEKSLSDVGISVGTDGKLSIDDSKFAKADMSKVSDLFNTQTGYGAQIGVKAEAVDYAAQFEASTTSLYNSNGGYSNSISSYYNYSV